MSPFGGGVNPASAADEAAPRKGVITGAATGLLLNNPLEIHPEGEKETCLEVRRAYAADWLRLGQLVLNALLFGDGWSG